jgi:hypothetical protein
VPLLTAGRRLAAAATALVMTGLVVVGLAMRPEGRLQRVTSWISIGLIAANAINLETAVEAARWRQRAIGQRLSSTRRLTHLELHRSCGNRPGTRTGAWFSLHDLRPTGGSSINAAQAWPAGG